MSLTQNNDKHPVFMASVSMHLGTFPSPETVERYELILPGTFDRILTMAEKEQESKISSDLDTVKIAIHRERAISTSILCGLTFGFVSVVMYFSLLAYSMALGNVTMFCTLFCAGAFAGLANLVRSFQVKGDKTTPSDVSVKK